MISFGGMLTDHMFLWKSLLTCVYACVNFIAFFYGICSLIFICSGLLFCASKLGLKEVHDWMVVASLLPVILAESALFFTHQL